MEVVLIVSMHCFSNLTNLTVIYHTSYVIYIFCSKFAEEVRMIRAELPCSQVSAR